MCSQPRRSFFGHLHITLRLSFTACRRMFWYSQRATLQPARSLASLPGRQHTPDPAMVLSQPLPSPTHLSWRLQITEPAPPGDAPPPVTQPPGDAIPHPASDASPGDPPPVTHPLVMHPLGDAPQEQPRECRRGRAPHRGTAELVHRGPTRMLGFGGASSGDPWTVTPQPPPQPERKLLSQEGLDGERVHQGPEGPTKAPLLPALGTPVDGAAGTGCRSLLLPAPAACLVFGL